MENWENCGFSGRIQLGCEGGKKWVTLDFSNLAPSKCYHAHHPHQHPCWLSVMRMSIIWRGPVGLPVDRPIAGVKKNTWPSLAWYPPDVFGSILIQPSPIGENHLLIIHILIFFYSISSLLPFLSHPAEFTHLCSLPLWLLGAGARTCSPPAWQQRYSLCPAASQAPHAQGTSRKVVGVDGDEGCLSIYAVLL